MWNVWEITTISRHQKKPSTDKEKYKWKAMYSLSLRDSMQQKTEAMPMLSKQDISIKWAKKNQRLSTWTYIETSYIVRVEPTTEMAHPFI